MEEFADLSEFSDFDRKLLNTLYLRLATQDGLGRTQDRSEYIQNWLARANTTLINYASCKVLSDISGVLAASGISESLYETFRVYYNHVLKSNSEAIRPDPPLGPDSLKYTQDYCHECTQGSHGYTQDGHVDSITLREAVLELIKYFLEVQRLMGSAAETKIKTTCDALSEIYSAYASNSASREWNGSHSDIDEIVKPISDKYKLPDLHSEFQLIITYFDTFPFNYAKFKDVYVTKVNDPAIPNIEIQRRYLVSLLKKNSHYTSQRNYINRICDQYEQTMKKVKEEINSENDRIRSLYDGTTSKLIDYTNSLIDELSN